MAQRSRKSRRASTKSGPRAAAATEARAAAATATNTKDVVLLYSRGRREAGEARTAAHMLTRKPADQSGAITARPLGATVAETAYDARAHALRLRTPSTELAFWLRCAGQAHLRSAVDECDLDIVSITRDGTVAPGYDSLHSTEADGDAMVSQALFMISEDRLRVALQSLLDLKALLLCFDDEVATGSAAAEDGGDVKGAVAQTSATFALRTLYGAPHGGCRCWVRADLYGAVVALAQLSEAALPPRSPSLVARDAALPTSRDAASRLTCVWRPCDSDARRAVHGQKAATAAAVATDIVLTPSPVAYEEVVERLACVRRLWQLRYNYSLLMPALHRCTTAKELCNLLFSHSRELMTRLRRHEAAAAPRPSGANGTAAPPARLHSDDFLLDRLLVLPERNARHRQEQQVLGGLLAKANAQCALRTEAWGPLAVRGTLKVRDGVYVVHYAPRQEVLRRVLRVAELYGLPPFLRSIRCHPHGPPQEDAEPPAGCHWDELDGSYIGVGSGAAVAGRPQAQHRQQESPTVYATHTSLSYSHLIFFAPDILDARSFAVPDAMQAQIVQEELIDLTMKHCAFGFLVGAADQIAFMLKSLTEYKTTLWERQVARKTAASGGGDVAGHVKSETNVAADDAGSGGDPALAAAPREGCSPLRDPMAVYVRALLGDASETGGGDDGGGTAGTADRMRVDWLCANRWSDEATYYGLVYGVVIESDLDVSLAGTEAMTPLELDGSDAGEDGTSGMAAAQGELRVQRDVAYYVAAVLELRR